MALTETKFHFSRIVLSAAVFISLCVATDAEEVRRCYWCGPLAEQVHRSQRAPPCNSPNSQITVCDPGFPYCAIVATSPPYVESRYCVKLYQDECYLLYCNSTRTWRVTCPCRGDLCNGPNTYREEDAFSGLAKLIARTQNARIKRALLSSSGFIGINTRKNRIDNTTLENKNISNDIENQISDATSGVVDSNMENQINNTESSTAVVKTESQIGESTTTADDMSKSEVSPITTPNPNTVPTELNKNSDDHNNNMSIQIDIPTVNAESSDLKTEIILMSSEATKLVDTKATDVTTNIPHAESTPQEIIKQAAIEITSLIETTTEFAQTTAKAKIDEIKVKPSKQMPAAEALQHNETPSTKTAEKTVTSTTVGYIQHTQATVATKPRNNTAIRIEAHVLTLAISIILQY